MHARITAVTVRRGRLNAALAIGRDTIAPAAQAQPGFVSVHFLVERSTDTVVTVSLWESEADMLRGEESGYYRDALAATADELIGSASTRHYEVAIVARAT